MILVLRQEECALFSGYLFPTTVWLEGNPVLFIYIYGLQDIFPIVWLHFSAITWASWRLKSPASQLFVQRFVQANIKSNIKAPHHWPFAKGIHQLPVDSLPKGPIMRKAFLFDDVTMCIGIQYVPSHGFVMLSVAVILLPVPCGFMRYIYPYYS